MDTFCSKPLSERTPKTLKRSPPTRAMHRQLQSIGIPSPAAKVTCEIASRQTRFPKQAVEHEDAEDAEEVTTTWALQSQHLRYARTKPLKAPPRRHHVYTRFLGPTGTKMLHPNGHILLEAVARENAEDIEEVTADKSTAPPIP